ncbi:Uncharacterized conserved protein [Phaffia rhodozyma]|uniref:Uncharacterized conserved protein n=1 Tax=Phaffia rhodozyma TaxID=264483 RepID=A0A0F7SN16_PHARH|nr:Uncharacterized conserved protein [Phaffia rhodozyma]
MSTVASGSAPEPTSEPTPTIALFARGVWSLFLLWPALRLAVAQEWGGPESKEKRLWFASTIVDEFESRHLKHSTSTPALTPPSATATTSIAPVSSVVSSESITAELAATSLSTLVPPPFGLDLDTLSDLLFDILLEEFETDTEDGSTEQIAKQLLVLWSAAVNLDESLVKQLEIEAEKVSKSKVQASQGAGGDDEDDDEDGSDDYSDMSEGEDERPPTLVPAAVKEEPEIDEDGFTMVKGKGKNR